METKDKDYAEHINTEPLIRWLEIQRKMGVELEAPESECNLLCAIIEQVKLLSKEHDKNKLCCRCERGNDKQEVTSHDICEWCVSW